MMNVRTGILAAALVVLSPVMASADEHMGMGDYEIMSMEELEFMPAMEDSPLQMAVLWGDPATGPSGFLLKIPAGLEEPLHVHTHGYRAVILEGQHLHWLEGEDMSMVAPLGEGGYWFQPGGQVHGDANPGDTETLALVIFDGPLDFLLPE